MRRAVEGRRCRERKNRRGNNTSLGRRDYLLIEHHESFHFSGRFPPVSSQCAALYVRIEMSAFFMAPIALMLLYSDYKGFLFYSYRSCVSIYDVGIRKGTTVIVRMTVH